METPWKWFKPL